VVDSCYFAGEMTSFNWLPWVVVSSLQTQPPCVRYFIVSLARRKSA
jgi:hypothetical protein